MKIKLALTGILVTQISVAAIPLEGLYSSVFGGYSYVPNNVSKYYYGNLYNQARFNSGYHAGGRIGIQTYPLRYEGEVTYLNADTHRFDVNNIRQINVGGQSNATLAMANVYYDFPEIIPTISPFLGAGIGYAWVSTHLNSEGPFDATSFKGTDSVFSYQGTAGLTYNFAENYALNIAYRYIGTDKANHLGKIFQTSLASVGVVYRFDGLIYK